MMQFLKKLVLKYNYVFDDLSVNSTKNWFLISRPEPILTIVAIYLYIAINSGPAFMKNREPYKLKTILMAYNVIQVVLSLIMTVLGTKYIISVDTKFLQSVDYSDNPLANLGATLTWLYFIAKISELLDTIFFVLRKKNSQLTFLHVYHHSVMPIIAWLVVKYCPEGLAIINITYNSFIHVIMYGYYFVAGLGPQYQKYLWWKKYLTSIQLVQFSMLMYFNSTAFFSVDCNFSKFLNVIITSNCAAFFYMFGMFYIKSYSKKLSFRNGMEQTNLVKKDL